MKQSCKKTPETFALTALSQETNSNYTHLGFSFSKKNKHGSHLIIMLWGCLLQAVKCGPELMRGGPGMFLRCLRQWCWAPTSWVRCLVPSETPGSELGVWCSQRHQEVSPGTLPSSLRPCKTALWPLTLCLRPAFSFSPKERQTPGPPIRWRITLIPRGGTPSSSLLQASLPSPQLCRLLLSSHQSTFHSAAHRKLFLDLCTLLSHSQNCSQYCNDLNAFHCFRAVFTFGQPVSLGPAPSF